MFDVYFSELFVIAIVALLVIGPERLPKVARTVGAFTGRMQRYMAQVKEEVNREMRFEELQKLQQEIKQSVLQETSALQASIHKTPSPVKIKPAKTAVDKLNDTEAKTSKLKPVKLKPVKLKPGKSKPVKAKSPQAGI